jgi:NADPH-dependent ferric siderophore reductase
MSRPEPRRIRHETRLRQLTVQRVQHLTPEMYRVALGGSDRAEGRRLPAPRYLWRA